MAKKTKKVKNINSLLKKTYLDPSTGFTGAKQLQKITKQPISVVKKFLNTQRAYTLHAPSIKRFPRLGLSIAAKIYRQVGIDLICWPNLAEYNDGYKYIVIMMCALTKKAHACIIKSRNTSDIQRAISQIIDKEILPYKIEVLHGDLEGAFISNVLKTYLKKTYGIKIYATHSGNKCFLVERLILTLKRMISRYMTHKNTFRYIDVLQQIVNNYNNKTHSTTKLSPNEILANPKPLTELAYANMELYQMKNHFKNNTQKRPKPRFKIGDFVRVSFARHPFSRGFTANYSEKIYIVTKRIDRGLLYVYNIKDPFDTEDSSDDNIRGIFYSHELIKAHKPEEFIIRDIIDIKLVGNQVYGLIHWLGYDRFSDNSWKLLNKKELGSLQNTHINLYNKLQKQKNKIK